MRLNEIAFKIVLLVVEDVQIKRHHELPFCQGFDRQVSKLSPLVLKNNSYNPT